MQILQSVKRKLYPLGACYPVPSRNRGNGLLGGVFAQCGHSARTAPIITVIIQVTTPKTTHLRNHA